jgi:hypothetical protein
MMAGAVYVPEAFEADILLPSQFFSGSTVSAHQPERRLMLAVLEDAVQIVAKHAGDKRARARRLVREAQQWISAPGSGCPFSFENICAVLNIDAAALRQGLCRLACAGENPTGVRVLAFATGRHVAGGRHRVTAPRAHRRRAE